MMRRGSGWSLSALLLLSGGILYAEVTLDNGQRVLGGISRYEDPNLFPRGHREITIPTLSLSRARPLHGGRVAGGNASIADDVCRVSDRGRPLTLGGAPCTS